MASIIKGVLLLASLAAASPASSGVYRDAVGREVAVPKAPQRLVSLAPNLTEILFALGLGSKVVGVTIFCDWPPEAREKPKVGGFINPSLEAIVALNPDLVLATADGNRPDDVHRLEELGVAVYVVDSRSVEDILETIAAVGRLTDRETQGLELVAGLRRRRDQVRAAVENRTPVPVFVALDRTPLITAGEGTFIGELIALAGGENIVRSSAIKYPVYNLEQLLKLDPAVILVAVGPSPPGGGNPAGSLSRLPGSESLRAVRQGRVHEVGEGDFFRPGPRIMETLEEMAEMFHPGILEQ